MAMESERMLQRNRIPTLRPRAGGQQFVIYGDSCSGRAGALHEETFAQVNAVIRALQDPPQFICFTGDEIMGLTTDAHELRKQWQHFFDSEMAWLDRAAIPLYHCTGNHTVYGPMSEQIFREVMAHLPENGPADQQGLSYFVARGELLLVFVNTLCSGRGGEGTVETEWLSRILAEHSHVNYKLVIGHHPVWTVNGYAGEYQRQIEMENGRRFWDILVEHQVLAYLCSHILAFDVQVQRGVLQICTAGAGTAHRMPEAVEYLHIAQAALDDQGLRFQVLDREGRLREWLAWELRLPPSETWDNFDRDSAKALPADCLQNIKRSYVFVWEIVADMTGSDSNKPQTLLCMEPVDAALPTLWLGISGADKQLTLLLSPQANGSPHRWIGPTLPANKPFRIQFAIHSGMGPGGLLWRWHDDCPWSSLIGASAWGAERLQWSSNWSIGECAGDQRFRGRDLQLRWHHQSRAFSEYLA